MVLADLHLKPGEAWEYCPREALRRVSKVLKDEFNLVGLMLYLCEIQLPATSKCKYAGDECRFRKRVLSLKECIKVFEVIVRMPSRTFEFPVCITIRYL